MRKNKKKIMEEKKWIMTEQMLENLENDPDNEQEYTYYIGGMLRSTHWLIFDSREGLFGDSKDCCDYEWYTKEEFLDAFDGQRWHRDV